MYILFHIYSNYKTIYIYINPKKGGLQWIWACVCWGNQVWQRNHGSSQLGPNLPAREAGASWLQGVQSQGQWCGNYFIHKSEECKKNIVLCAVFAESVLVFLPCSLIKMTMSWMCSSAGMVWSNQWPAPLLVWVLSLKLPSLPSCSSRPLRRPPQPWSIWMSTSWRWWCIDTAALSGPLIPNCWAATTDTYKSHMLYYPDSSFQAFKKNI